MDDLMQRLQALLSDPESMRNLAELAAMLQENDTSADSVQEAAPAMPAAECSGADAQTNAAEDVAMPDISKLLAVGQALSAVQQDETTALILALKPHLSAERAKRADQAAKMLRLYTVAGILRENGVLNDLLNA